MTFLLRIFFSGLIAFVPSSDGKELIVLLPDATHGCQASDHTAIEPHLPVLLVRAAQCEGCGTAEDSIAPLVFPEVSKEAARDRLSAALLHGTAWRLDGADLSLRLESAGREAALPPLEIERKTRPVRSGRPAPLPLAPSEEKDFSWIASLGEIAPSAGIVDPVFLGPHTPAGKLAGRLRLESGTIRPYRLVRVAGRVAPLGFRALGSKSGDVAYSQALADVVVAEIRVQGDAVRLVESRFGGGEQRTLRLSPGEAGEVVEIALLNVPPSTFQPIDSSQPRALPEPGRHFEKYYDLAKEPPVVRPVPYALAGGTGIDLQEEGSSALLDALRLGLSRGAYDRVICPMAQLTDGGARQ